MCYVFVGTLSTNVHDKRKYRKKKNVELLKLCNIELVYVPNDSLAFNFHKKHCP